MDYRKPIAKVVPLFFLRARARIERAAILSIAIALFAASALLADTLAAPSQTLQDLHSADRRRKIQAVEKLHNVRTPEASGALSGLLTLETDPHVRLAILDSLAAQSDPAAVPAVAKLLADPLAALRQRAAQTLGLLGGSAAENAVLKALRKETDAGVRAALVQALSLCGSAQSISDLKTALADKNPAVRGNAAHALSRIPGGQAANALQNRSDSEPDVRKTIDEALRRHAKEAK